MAGPSILEWQGPLLVLRAAEPPGLSDPAVEYQAREAAQAKALSPVESLVRPEEAQSQRAMICCKIVSLLILDSIC